MSQHASIAAAISSGFHPFGRLHGGCVTVVNRDGEIDEVQLTSDEYSDVIMNGIMARAWVAERCDGHISGRRLRPLLGAHLVAAGRVWRTG